MHHFRWTQNPLCFLTFYTLRWHLSVDIHRWALLAFWHKKLPAQTFPPKTINIIRRRWDCNTPKIIQTICCNPILVLKRFRSTSRFPNFWTNQRRKFVIEEWREDGNLALKFLKDFLSQNPIHTCHHPQQFKSSLKILKFQTKKGFSKTIKRL